MKCYLIYDAYLGSFYNKDAEIDGIRKGDWVSREYQDQALIKDKDLAQKLFRMLGKLSRSTLQLMEVDIPDETIKEKTDAAGALSASDGSYGC